MGNHGVTVSVSKVKSGEPESLGEKNETQKYLLRPIGQESGRSKGREKREDRGRERQAGRQALASSGGPHPGRGHRQGWGHWEVVAALLMGSPVPQRKKQAQKVPWGLRGQTITTARTPLLPGHQVSQHWPHRAAASAKTAGAGRLPFPASLPLWARWLIHDRVTWGRDGSERWLPGGAGAASSLRSFLHVQ